jgi:tetratricopeptide (TPR) repeat protein
MEFLFRYSPTRRPRSAERDPEFVPAHLALGQAYEQRRIFREAISELERAVSLSGGSPVYVAALAHAYGATGRRSEPWTLKDDLNKLAGERYVAPFDLAIAWLGLGENERALASLERAIEDRSPRLLFLMVEPRFDPLRSDRHLEALIERVGPVK